MAEETLRVADAGNTVHALAAEVFQEFGSGEPIQTMRFPAG